MKEPQKPSKPGPPQTSPPEKVEDADWILSPKVEVTYVLRPPPHEETDQTQWQERQRALGRKLGAEKKHLDAQFAAEARTMIDEHPHEEASTLARWLQSKSETKSLPGVTRPDGKPMEHRSLAKKIIRYRQQK